jgi:uncharacterized protein YacL (UPF0231 family)
MANIESTLLRNAFVLRDSVLTWRLYDAFGIGVAKYAQEFVNLPVDDATGDPTEFVNTITEAGAGNSTAVVTDSAGGALLITTAANEDDGYQMQLGGAGGGECVKLDGQYPTYFGIRFQINDVDQTDCLFGFCITDTDAIGGVTDGVFFRSVDGSGVLNFVIEKDSVESITAADTLADATNVTAEFYYDGTNITAYINGAQVAQIANTDVSFPDDEELRLTMEFLTGEAVANTCTIDWVRLIHIRN